VPRSVPRVGKSVAEIRPITFSLRHLRAA
jgi:hypothetical protein